LIYYENKLVTMVFFKQIFVKEINMNENSENNGINMQENSLQKCELELQQLKDSFKLISADFQNLKNRTIKEKAGWISSCQSDLLLDLLPIVDDFDRAFLEYNKSQDKTSDNWITGFELIHKAFYKFLDKYGIQEIPQIGIFDPEFHEGISQVESPDHKADEIVQTVQKGYMFKDKIMRPAKVIVAK